MAATTIKPRVTLAEQRPLPNGNVLTVWVQPGQVVRQITVHADAYHEGTLARIQARLEQDAVRRATRHRRARS